MRAGHPGLTVVHRLYYRRLTRKRNQSIQHVRGVASTDICLSFSRVTVMTYKDRRKSHELKKVFRDVLSFSLCPDFQIHAFNVLTQKPLTS